MMVHNEPPNTSKVKIVFLDSSDLDVCSEQKDGYVFRRTIAVDTSDLEEHYEFYKFEQRFKVSKTVATDTHDLQCRNKSRRTADVSIDTNDLMTFSPESYCSMCKGVFVKRNNNVEVNVQLSFHENSTWTETSATKDVSGVILSDSQNSNEVPSQSDVKVNLYLDNEENKTPQLLSNNGIEKLMPCGKTFESTIKKLKQTRPLLMRKEIQENPSLLVQSADSKNSKDDCANDYEESHSDNRGSSDADSVSSDSSEIGRNRYCLNFKGVKAEQSKTDVCVKQQQGSCKKVSERRFECDICKARFHHKYNIIVHLQNHNLGKTFSCGDCGRSFLALTQLRKHVQTHMASTSQDGDSHRLIKVEELESNPEGKQEVNCCDICGVSFESGNCVCSSQSVKTIQPALCRSKALFNCLTCGKEFRCRSALKCHETVHTGERNFVCEICNKAFPTKAGLKAHTSTHTGCKPFVCTTCGKAFAKNDSLKTHLRKHTGDRPFKCDICSQAFDRKFTLKNHRVTHTGEKTCICPTCGKAFATRGALSTHERTRHSINPEKPRKPYKRRVKDFEPCVCDVCGKVYSNQANLRIHKITHTGDRPFLCTVCGQSFGKKYTLQCHTRKHTDERPFACDICGLTFFRNHTLKTHKLRHTGERPHVCPLCGSSFIQSASLAYHIRHHDRPPRVKGMKSKNYIGVFPYDQHPLVDNPKIHAVFLQHEATPAQ